jgi:hypothetical protein
MTRILLIALLVTVLAPPAPAPACPMEGMTGAPCCASDASCGMSLTTAGCCRVEPVKGTQRPSVARAGGKDHDDRPDAAVLVAAAPAAIPQIGPAARPDTGAPPGARHPVPLYILNASILR